VTRRCQDCGARFEAHADYHRLCWRCWRRRRDRELTAGGYDDGYSDGYRAGRPAAGTQPAARLDAELLRGLVQLCHPDRHPPERAELASRSTATLLNMLGEVS
jgi:hypothetical protein